MLISLEHTAASNENKTLKQPWRNSLLIYEGDVMHPLKATDLIYVTITITLISCFISLLERHIKRSVQLETAKRNGRFREERKNEEIISRNCLPRHKRASSFMSTHEAVRLHFLHMLSRYSWMSRSVQHAGTDRHSTKAMFSLCGHCSSLHAEGLKMSSRTRLFGVYMS